MNAGQALFATGPLIRNDVQACRVILSRRLKTSRSQHFLFFCLHLSDLMSGKAAFNTQSEKWSQKNDLRPGGRDSEASENALAFPLKRAIVMLHGRLCALFDL